MFHLTWIPTLVAGPVLAAVSHSVGPDWATIVAVGGMIATLISAATGLVVALRRKDSPVVIVTAEQAKLLGIDEEKADTAIRKRRIRRKRA